ncbi:hypothetical protein GJ496_010915, partial [Pomphorhynchus laevis]
IVNDDDAIVFENQIFHRRCLKCAECNNPIEDLFFTNISHTIRCQWCHLHSNILCQRCKSQIRKGANMEITSPIVRLDSAQWHLMCFECTVCEENLVSKRFVLKNEILYCESFGNNPVKLVRSFNSDFDPSYITTG